MRARVKITDLTEAQWARLQDRVLTSYQLHPGTATVCAVFEQGAQQEERHVEMPIQAFATLMTELAMLDRTTAALTPDALPDHLEEARNAADPQRAAERAGCPDGVEGCLADHSQTTRPL